MEIISLEQARKKGLTHYFTGVPCANGHVDKRNVKGRACFTCNKNRVAAFEAKRRAEEPAYRRKDHLRLTYGLTDEDVAKMKADQKDACATCQEVFISQPHVDHCHATGKVRGLLCGPCNRALGMIKDNPETLRQMIAYLLDDRC